jgi:hypothetical protein
VNEPAARALLERLADAPVVLWRGDSVSGSDIDLLVTGEWEQALHDAGLVPRGDGHWANAAGDVIVDPLPVERWPRAYPPAAQVIARADGRPPVASAADRTQIFVADAVGGRSMTKLAPKLRAVGGGDRVAALVLRAQPRRDALPWTSVLRVLVRAPRTAPALLARLRSAVRRRLPQKKR